VPAAEVSDLGEAPQRRGCLFWGCAAACLVAVVIGGSVGIAWYRVYRDLEAFSSTESMAVPVSQADQDAFDRVAEKLERIAALGGMEEGADPREGIVLSPDEINAWIAWSLRSKADHLPGPMAFAGEGDRLVADVSWPLDGSETEKAGRFFNGKVRARLHFDAGELTVEIEKVTSPAGKELSDRVLELGSRVLTDRLKLAFGDVFKGLSGITVREGKIHIEP